MVHHFFFFRPIRTFFGLMLLVGAVLCFLRAVQHSRSDMGVSDWSASSDWHWFHRNRTAATPQARTVETAARPLPNPPPPTHDGHEPKPDWVDRPAHLESRGGLEVYVATATAGPYLTNEECDRALPGEIDRVVTDFAEKEFPQAIDGTVKLDRDLVENHLIQDRYRETVNTASFGPMLQEHVLLVFDRQIRSAIEQQWRSIMVAQRLQVAAIGSGAVLLLLGGVYSLLRWKPAGVRS
ncbi:MAG TPA: hypothetical protein VHX65_06925 [Pirellulales bacterium]|nr:hypothetical protein [Pirellulales bacterium]